MQVYMGARPRLRTPTEEKLRDIMDEYEYSSLGAAIDHALREAGYDV